MRRRVAGAGLIMGKLAHSLRHDGVYATLRKAFVHMTYGPAEDDGFDRQYGTDTGGLVPLWKVSVRSANARYGLPYRATTEAELTRALGGLGENLARFTFVDLGCGKGRTLLIASRFGFRSVIGVEFAAELAAIARANLAKRGLPEVTVIEGDAADYAFPEAPLVVYLYHPFAGEVMGKVMATLERHVRRWPLLPLYVVYKNPLHGGLFDQSASFAYLGAVPDHPDILTWKAVGADRHPAA
ncbi:MAG TPA: class I SAM-dependent methyltransferase [Stellaceae bacterium]|nr:class I SAM-dependent methyltransferase [Stellaceae bacterium]